MKGFWGRFKRGEEGQYQRAYKRLSSVSSQEVLDWSRQASNSLYMLLEAYERDKDGAALIEARIGTLTLLAAVQVLEERS